VPLRPTRRKDDFEGLWLITFADLMVQLMAFFAVIYSFSAQDQQKLQQVLQSFQHELGVKGAGILPGNLGIDPNRAADLGSGIGSVGMAAAWRCPGAEVHTVEAQAISVRLARKSAAYNGLQDRYHITEGDLRDPGLFQGEAPFDLVLGSPPYWPVGSRVEASHPQAIPARLEVRGDIGDYALAAARILAPGGVFACVFPLDQIERAEQAYRAAGILLLHRQDVIFKEGEPYGIALFAGTRQADLPEGFGETAELPARPAPITIRRRDGRVDPGIALVRLVMGFPPGL
jgi:tRNA1(Val) A37 N6-methylase TrmN6